MAQYQETQEAKAESGESILPRHMSFHAGQTLNLNEEKKEASRCPYTDSLEVSWLGWVQTPQYFEHCYELQVLGDPCGHRNAVFFDAVQCGLDGYGAALFAGTNAIFRRDALDSIGGIKYGTLTEDAFTGRCLNQKGWDSAYFRKDWEGEKGDPRERFPLATGDVPDSVAATFKQRKRWAQGSAEIMMMAKEKPDLCMDWEWWTKFQEENPVVCPPSGKERDLKTRFMRYCFFFNAAYYPWHSFAAIIYFILTCYMCITGEPPFYLNSEVILAAMVPWILLRGLLNRFASETVQNSDSKRGQETWFAFSSIYLWALIDAYYSKFTGKQATWSNTGGGARGAGSVLEIPNIIIFTCIFVCWIYSIYAFFDEEQFQTPWAWVAGPFFGLFLLVNLWPLVKMSTQEYLGWSYDTLTDFSGYFSVMLAFAFMLFFFSEWKHTYMQKYSCSPYWADACYNTTQYNIYRVKATFDDGVDTFTSWKTTDQVSISVDDDETFKVENCEAGKLWTLDSDYLECSSGNTSMPTFFPTPAPTHYPSAVPTA